MAAGTVVDRATAVNKGIAAEDCTVEASTVDIDVGTKGSR